MVKVSVSAQSMAAFHRQLKEYERRMGKTGEGMIRELGKRCGQKLAYFTQPWKLTAGVGKKLQLSIAKQAHRAISAANVSGIPGGAGAVHKHYRIRGRVPKGLKTEGRYNRAPVGLGEREAWVEKKMRKAGAAKGAWLAAAADCGKGRVSRVPVWLRDHTKGGAATVRPRGLQTGIILHNNLPWAGNVIDFRGIGKALSGAYKSYYNQMKRELEKI